DTMSSALKSDSLDGGSGNDTADYSSREGDLNLELTATVPSLVTSGQITAATETDHLESLETVFTGSGNDSISVIGVDEGATGVLTQIYVDTGGGDDSASVSGTDYCQTTIHVGEGDDGFVNQYPSTPSFFGDGGDDLFTNGDD